MEKRRTRGPAERFFFAQAGYSYPAGADKRAQTRHRWEGAHALAEAERHAREAGWRCEWSGDECWSWHDMDHEGCPRNCTHEAWCCTLTDGEGVVRASLGGIIDPDAAYSRVVEAELAAEALHDVRQAERADAEASRYMAL